MTQLMSFFEGKKTFLCAVAGAVVSVLYLFGILDEKVATTLLGLLGFGSVASLRASKK